MSSTQSTVDFIVEQIAAAGFISTKKMFGEYGLYCDGKIVALVCDNQLFVKKTAAGKEFLGECIEMPPYPGAKPYFFISGEKWDEGEWLSELIKISVAQLPMPKKKTTSERHLK